MLSVAAATVCHMPPPPNTLASAPAVLRDDQALTVGDLTVTVRVSGRRTRLGLTVERDRTLRVHVPEGCSVDRAEEFIRESRRWIEEKLSLASAKRALTPVRRMKDGEIFRYLARDYRLRLTVDSAASGSPVRLVGGDLLVDRGAAPTATDRAKAVRDWYARVGRRWAAGRTQPWADRMDVPEPPLEVRDIGRRWGAYRRATRACPAGRVSLHWSVFQLPPPLIDYVIAHELAHIKVSGHGPDYWRLLSRAIPECRERKAELDELGRSLWLGDIEARDHPGFGPAKPDHPPADVR